MNSLADTQRFIQVEKDATSALSRINSHELVCSERYGNLRKDIAQVKSIISWCAIALVSTLSIITWAFIKQKLGL